MGRIFIIVGVGLVVLGFAWPLISRLGLGRLPGDIAIEREGVKFYFPIVTCIIVSVVLSFLSWLWRRFS